MHDLDRLLMRIRTQARHDEIRVTQHAAQEMAADAFTLQHVLHAIANGAIIEHYPEHRRGACCLIGGETASGRPLHLVCTTAHDILIIITVYEPMPPKWSTPTQRGTTSS